MRYKLLILLIPIFLVGCTFLDPVTEDPIIWSEPRAVSFLFEGETYNFLYYESNSQRAYITKTISDNIREHTIVQINSDDQFNAATAYLLRQGFNETNIQTIR